MEAGTTNESWAEVETTINMLQQATDDAVGEGWDKEDVLGTLHNLLQQDSPQDVPKAIAAFALLRKERGRVEAFTCDVCGAELVLESDGKMYCPTDEHGYGYPS